jgi:hypothetical protein
MDEVTLADYSSMQNPSKSIHGPVESKELRIGSRYSIESMCK